MADKKRRKPARKTTPKVDPEMRELLERMRRGFTAADLQKYTEPFVGVPAEQVIAEMEAIHRRLSRKRA